MLTVAVPVALYIASIYALYYQLTRVFDPFHLLLLAGTAVVVVAVRRDGGRRASDGLVPGRPRRWRRG